MQTIKLKSHEFAHICKIILHIIRFSCFVSTENMVYTQILLICFKWLLHSIKKLQTSTNWQHSNVGIYNIIKIEWSSVSCAFIYVLITFNNTSFELIYYALP